VTFLKSPQQVSDPTTWAQYTCDNRSRVTQTLYSNGVKSVYGYDSSGRTTALTHRNASNAIIIGYTASYDSAGRLGGVTENNGSATAYGYDDEGRLLSEVRTGTTPYSSQITYNAFGALATQLRIDAGLTKHSANYTYDDDRKLTSVSDSAPNSSTNGTYSWNADSTLRELPGPGYVRRLEYDEEGRIISISKVVNGTVTPLFEYAYGFDGGRRSAKNLLTGVLEWYPCGVACCAGELVSLTSSNNGATWSTKDSSLPSTLGAKLINGNLMLNGLTSSETLITGSQSSQNIVDSFGIPRGTTDSGSAFVSNRLETPVDSGLWAQLQVLQLAPQQAKPGGMSCKERYDHCMKTVDDYIYVCAGIAIGIGAVGAGACTKACTKTKNVAACLACLIAIGAIEVGLGYICLTEAGKQRNQCAYAYELCLKKRQKKPVARATK
jgi:YD repeat-containing protein